MIHQALNEELSSLASKLLKSTSFEYCNCPKCPLDDRIRTLARILSDANTHCDRKERITVTSIGSGHLGTEEALSSGLLALGFTSIKFELVDLLYQKTEPYVRSEQGTIHLYPDSRSEMVLNSSEVGFCPKKNRPLKGIEIADLLAKFALRIDSNSNEHQAHVAADFSPSIKAHIIKKDSNKDPKTNHIFMCIDVDPEWLEAPYEGEDDESGMSDYDSLKSQQLELATKNNSFLGIYEMGERTSRHRIFMQIANLPRQPVGHVP